MQKKNISFEQLSDEEAAESFKKNYPEMYKIKKKAKEKEKEAEKDLTVKSTHAKYVKKNTTRKSTFHKMEKEF